MITLQNLGDLHDNYVISIDQFSSNKRSHWKLELTTSDVSPAFINSDNRAVDISIVPLHEIERREDSVIYLPVVAVGISYLKDQVKIYYASQESSKLNSSLNPRMILQGYLLSSDDSSHNVQSLCDEPYIRIELKVLQDNAGNNQSSDTSESQSLDHERVHIERNENANGGLDLPVGEKIPERADPRRSVEHT